MIEESEFYVTLQSNQNIHNSCLSFNVSLPRTVHLYSDWHVAVTAISTTAEFEELHFLPTFVVTTNISHDDLYNNEALRALKLVTFDKHWRDTGTFIATCSPLEYHKVYQKSFQDIVIEFVDVNATPVKVKNGVTYITLHFKRSCD